MKFEESEIKGVYFIEPAIHRDSRGMFFRTYCEQEFSAAGFKEKWVQGNYSITEKKGTVRGLHYQLPPHSETKLVSCTRGKIVDVIVDLRENSPTFKKHVTVELSEENKLSVLIPRGCAHGFQTLADNCHLSYFHSAFYAQEYEAGIRYNDPLLGIIWPLPVTEISERDNTFPLLTKQFKGISI